MSKLSSETEYAIRKAINVVIYSVLFMAVSCSSTELELNSKAQVNNTPTVLVTNTPEIKDSSKQTAFRLTVLYDKKNCKDFFNAFPNTFKEFDQLYGFDDKKGEHILYSRYQEHVSYFFDCSETSDIEKLKKSIEIGINGKWEADAVGLFQDSTFHLIKDNINETEKILENLTREKASSFWFFLLDGAHPTDKEKVEKVDLLVSLLGKESRQAKLLLEQFQKLQASED